MPTSLMDSEGPPAVGVRDPNYDTAGMVGIKLDMGGKLLFLRAVPPQVARAGETSARDPDWDWLFAQAGLDKTQFSPASPKFAPPEIFDTRADWEGHLPDHPDLPLHVAAAAYLGKPVYFQVIAPWDKPSKEDPGHAEPGSTNASAGSQRGEDLSAMFSVLMIVGLLVLGSFFARRNIRRGRSDSKGAWRLAVFAGSLNCAFGLANYRYIPQPNYIATEFLLLGIPLLFTGFLWIGYMAVEPYARRLWPTLMVSWQRLLSGRLRDPLVGRDLLLGILSGSVIAALLLCANGFIGLSEAFPVRYFFGQGLLPSLSWGIWTVPRACFDGLTSLAVLTVFTGVLRKRWLGLLVTGAFLGLQYSPINLLDYALGLVYALVFLGVLVRIGLVAAASFSLVSETVFVSPPLALNQWYAGRAAIALVAPIVVLVYGFYVSLGGQPIFGSSLNEE